MNKNIEKELKILVTEKQFHDLCALYPDLTFKKQVNTYYDTKDQSIHKMQGAMRIREKNNIFIFTLKKFSSEDLLEFECEVTSNSLEALETEEIQNLLTSYQIYGPFYEETTLTTYRAVYDNGYAEVCFDKNEYSGIMDYEIEYEYKKEHNGIDAFQHILDPIQVTYKENCISKIQRALDRIPK